MYLIFNEGWAASSGERLVRGELCAEAIRLGRLLYGLMPDDPEVAGLLALMLLHDSRRQARVDAPGELVALDDQNRAQWDRGRIREGERLLEDALRRRRPGSGGIYVLQAAIAALHATAPSPQETDYAQIAALYGELARCTPSPVVEVNRAVALGRAEDPSAGLTVLEPLLRAGTLESYAPLHAAARRCTPLTPTCSTAPASPKRPHAPICAPRRAPRTRSLVPSCAGARTHSPELATRGESRWGGSSSR